MGMDPEPICTISEILPTIQRDDIHLKTNEKQDDMKTNCVEKMKLLNFNIKYNHQKMTMRQHKVTRRILVK